MLKSILVAGIAGVMSFGTMAEPKTMQVIQSLTEAQMSAFQTGLRKLTDTKLQFQCSTDKFEVQKILKPKPSNSLPVATFDAHGEVVNVKPVGEYACPEGEIDLGQFCAEVVCSYTEVLSAEEAKQMVEKENAANSLLNSQR